MAGNCAVSLSETTFEICFWLKYTELKNGIILSTAIELNSCVCRLFEVAAELVQIII